MRIAFLALIGSLLAGGPDAQTLVQAQQSKTCQSRFQSAPHVQGATANRDAFMKTCMADMNRTPVLPGDAVMQAPPGATGVCKDGKYTGATKRESACAGHGGLARWL